MFNKFLICWSELRHSRKISAKQAESAIINAGLGICVRVVCECVCVHFGVCDSCVWLGLWRCVPCISLSGCLSSVIGAYISLNSLHPLPPPSRSNPSHFGGGSSQVFFFPASVILLSFCLLRSPSVFSDFFFDCLFGLSICRLAFGFWICFF